MVAQANHILLPDLSEESHSDLIGPPNLLLLKSLKPWIKVIASL